MQLVWGVSVPYKSAQWQCLYCLLLWSGLGFICPWCLSWQRARQVNGWSSFENPLGHNEFLFWLLFCLQVSTHSVDVAAHRVTVDITFDFFARLLSWSGSYQGLCSLRPFIPKVHLVWGIGALCPSYHWWCQWWAVTTSEQSSLATSRDSS